MAYINIPHKDNTTPLTATEWNYLVDKLNARRIRDLVDVEQADPVSGDMLRHNGSGWTLYDILEDFYTKEQIDQMVIGGGGTPSGGSTVSSLAINYDTGLLTLRQTDAPDREVYIHLASIDGKTRFTGGTWTSSQYHKNDMTREGSWLGIALRDTTDHLAPQETGSPQFIYNGDNLTKRTAVAKHVFAGMKLNPLNGGYIKSFGVYAVAGLSYRISYVINPATGGVPHPISIFVADVDGWHNVPVEPILAAIGNEVYIYAEIFNPNEIVTDTPIRYRYSSPNNYSAPASGNMAQGKDNLAKIGVHMIDNDGVDRDAFLASLANGDSIVYNALEWTITNSVKVGDVYEFTVNPAQMMSSNVVTADFIFRKVTAGDIDYYGETDYFASIPNVTGIYNIDGGLDNVIETDDFLGVDIQYQVAVVSPDWFILAYSGVATSSGGGGGGGETIDIIDNLDTPRADAALSANMGVDIKNQLAGKEPVFTKNTAFNKNFGTTAGTVSEGNHGHGSTAITNQSAVTGATVTEALNKLNSDISGSSHTHDNKDILDLISEEEYNNWNESYSWGDQKLDKLSDHIDVNATTPLIGQALIWDDVSMSWIPKFILSGLGYAELAYTLRMPPTNVPTSGRLSFNNATPSLVTIIYINKISENGTDLSTYLSEMKLGDWLNVHLRNDINTGQKYDITGSPTLTGDVFAVPVSYYGVSGVPLANNDKLSVLWRIRNVQADLGTSDITNQSLVSGVTATEAFNTLHASSHSHTNKVTLDKITETNYTNWNTAYGWGNHASEGYLKTYTETDPTVPAHVKSITTTEKSNWNTAYGWGNHASAGYLNASSVLFNFYIGGTLQNAINAGENLNFIAGSGITLTGDTNSLTIAYSGGATGVSSVTGTAPIVSSGGANPAISITAASQSASGSMSAADKIKLDGIASGANNYVLPNATDTVYGGVKLYSTTAAEVGGKIYGIQKNSAGQMTVNVPWTDTVYTLPAATATVRGGIELFSNTVQTVAAASVSTTASRTYGIQVNSDGQAVVNVPWTESVYTLPHATSTSYGGVKLFSDSVQGTASNAVSSTAARTYGVQVNADGQMVVNVPWSDTNTVYTDWNLLVNGTKVLDVVSAANLDFKAGNGVELSYAANAITISLPADPADTTAPVFIGKLKVVPNEGSGSVTEVTATAPIVSSGGDTPRISITAATASAAGSMSAADKSKLDGISSGANNYVLPNATTSVYGGVKLYSETTAEVGGKVYGIQKNAAGQMTVNVPWTDTVYTLPAATTTVRGGVKLGSDTVQGTAVVAPSSTAGRTYPLQFDANGHAGVNVPWTDTNTVYSGWNLYTNSTLAKSVISGGNVGFNAGTGISISYANDIVTISSSAAAADTTPPQFIGQLKVTENPVGDSYLLKTGDTMTGGLGLSKGYSVTGRYDDGAYARVSVKSSEFSADGTSKAIHRCSFDVPPAQNTTNIFADIQFIKQSSWTGTTKTLPALVLTSEGLQQIVLVGGNKSEGASSYINSRLDIGFNQGVPAQGSTYDLRISGATQGNGFHQSSLRRLKENIIPFEKSAVDIIDSLEVVEYDLIDGEKNQIGIIIDDSPAEVASNDHQSVDLYKTIFVMARAIQELTDRIKILENGNI